MASSIIALANRQKAELARLDEANLDAIARAYAVSYNRLQGDIDALTLAIEAEDEPTPASIKRLPQYKRLVRNGADELDKFTVFLNTSIAAAGIASIAMGLSHSAALVNASGVKFTGLTGNAMKPLLKYLDDNGPLYARLAKLTGATIDSVVDAIISGVGAGFNPQKTARLIQDAFGGGLTDALRNMRTVQLYSYRDSARANYMATDGIVTGWMWWAELDELTCEACVAEHGSIHDLDEQLSGHYNCRCAALPYIEGLTEPEQTGEGWFNSLRETQQAAFMGQSKLEAYQAGKFSFNDLKQFKENEVYGEMIAVTPLKDLIGD